MSRPGSRRSLLLPDADTPGWSTPLDEAPLLAVDVETTGLDPSQHRIVSAGWVPIHPGGIIDLGAAEYFVVRSGDPTQGEGGGEGVGESATVHGLTDDVVDAGITPAELWERFRTALQGRMMLAHFAPIEQNFFAALAYRYDPGATAPSSARRLLSILLPGLRQSIPAVDTLAIERRRMERIGTYPRGEDLRLPRVRRRYGLPDYANHNALTDALACAELYLALTAHARTHSHARVLGDLRY